MSAVSGQQHVLSDSFPWFLIALEEKPERAAAGFHEFAWKLLTSNPPPSFHGLELDERQDIIADLVVRCLRDDFAVLRKYKNQGRPFAGWLATVAHHQCLDYLRVRSRDWKRHRSLDAPNPDGVDLMETLAAPEKREDDRIGDRELLDKVRACMQKLSERCQVLLAGAADGMKPRDLTVLLGWPPEHNKKVHDALRECRKSLLRHLQKA